MTWIKTQQLHYNIFAGVSKNSIDTQKDEISKLESQIDSLEYIYQHELFTIK